jgi:acyl-CoA reductase-like NAD-dependent aldehyde dehydrogenase
MNAQGVELKSFSECGFSPSVDAPRAKERSQMDGELDRLRRGASEFVNLSLDEKIALARSMQRGYLKIAERSVAVACKAKGIEPGTPLEGEEWTTGPWGVVRHLRLIAEQLSALKESGNTIVGKVGRTSEGNLEVRVFPANGIDGILYKDVTVDVRMQKDVTTEQLDKTRASFYKNPGHSGRVVLVLGAGNLAMIPVMDVITMMFNEGKVCMLKMNPVNAYLGPFIEEAFAPAIERGFLSVAYGGVEEARYLIDHPLIDDIHITGSDRTHDTIVWGPPGEERERRMAGNEPLLGKSITSELGNVSPVIIMPGPYSDKQLRFMAEDIAGYFTMNSSFLCCAAKLIVVPKGWEKRALFIDILADILQGVPLRKAYYPGAAERFETFTAGRTNIRSIGAASQGKLPWTLVTDLDSEKADEPLFTCESFCPVLGETAVGSSDPLVFLEKAVDFVNERVWGTLSATLVVHPTLLKDRSIEEGVERGIGRLRYGTVCLNAFPGMSFGFGSPPWGAYPGSTPLDIKSGRGWVHNTAMLEGVEKVVARFPFERSPKPSYFPSHRTLHTMMRRMTALEEEGSWSKVFGVVAAAMRG